MLHKQYRTFSLYLFIAILFGLTNLPNTYAEVIVGTPGDDTIVITSETDCDGVESDGGNDTIIVENDAEVTKEALASGETATAEGTAIDTGSGVDSVNNFGLVSTVTQAEASIADVTETIAASALSDAVGIGAENSINTVSNAGVIDVDALATAEAVSVTLGGSGPATTTLTGSATAAGVALGDWSDNVYNELEIDVSSQCTVAASGVTLDPLSDSTVTAQILSEAEATGITVGAGALDVITNTGNIWARSESSATTTDVNISPVGTAPASVSTTVAARAKGIDGGDSSDRIFNYLGNTAIATSDVTSTGVTVEVGGLGESEATVTAAANAVGIDGGDGSDTIENEGDLYSAAASTTNASDVTVEFIVKGTANSTITASVAAVGIAGGSGDDSINNAGEAIVTSNASGTATSVSVNLLGAAVANASVTAEAESIGLDGGDNNDTITNVGLNAVAVSHATSTGVGVDVQAAPAGAVLGIAYTDATTDAVANATGIKGGSGVDSVTNEGPTLATATAETDSAGVSVNVGDVSGGLVIGGAVSLAGSTAEATATGIAGTEDVTNNALLGASAISDVDAASVSVNVQGTIAGIVGGGAIADTSADAVATSLGINGTQSNDHIVNSDVIGANSEATLDSASVSVNVGITSLGVQGQIPVANVANTADATATGINTGAGSDQIENSGTIQSDAYSWLDATSVSVDAILNIGVGVGTAFADASGTSTTTAVGISSGEGGDTITSTGTVSATADSTNLAGANIFNITITGGSGIADGSTTTTATALGIDTGGGDDSLVSENSILADADTAGEVASLAVNVEGYVDANASTVITSNSTGVDLGTGDDYFWNKSTITADSSDCVAAAGVTGVNLVGATFAQANTTAHAIGAGIIAGEGADTIINDGALDVDGYAWAYAESFSSSFLAGYSEASAGLIANSDAVGIDGGSGEDSIQSTQAISVLSKSEAWADSYTVSFLSGGDSYTGITGDANAKGISGGDDQDIISNNATLSVTAESLNDFAIANPNLGGIVSANFQFFGYAASDTSVTMSAEAVGIDAGAGNDQVQSTQKITVRGKSTARASNLIVELGGAAFSESNVTADADATGIAGGDGNDTLLNDGEIDLRADTIMPEDAISKTWNGAAGFASAIASTTGNANGIGIDAGAGNDFVKNTALIKVRSKTDGNAGVMNMFAGIDVSLFESNLVTQASATGIVGGQGTDTLINEGTLDIRADSLGESSSRGVLRLFGYMDASTTATSNSEAVGIDGGTENDFIQNTNTVTVTGYSKANANNYTLDLSGAKIYEAAATVSSVATGLYGNEGNDSILNQGTVTVNSESLTEDRGESAPPLSVNVFGDADADASTNVTAAAVGLDGGTGNDQIQNTNTVTVDSTTNTRSPNTVVNLVGGALGKADIQAEASATGIQGGEGNDTVLNSAALTIDAESYGNASGTTVELLGYADCDATSTGTANAVGIDGGDDDDGITNLAAIAVTSTAEATTASTLVDLVGGSTGQVGSTSYALATGIQGGLGSDTIDSEGTINAGVTATVNASGTTVLLAGYAPATAELSAEARATGIAGGDGELDVISNADVITVLSEAFGTAGAVTVNLAGAAPASVATSADAYATGIDGESGDDAILNQAAISAEAISDVGSESTSVELAGYGDSNATVEATANALGIGGGIGSDAIDNQNILAIHAMSTLDASGVTVGLAGYAPATADITTQTTATGISGGDGTLDTIINTSTIAVLSEAYGTAGGVTVNLAGAAPAIVSTDAVAYATGIDGEEGDDSILNQGLVDATATSDVGSGAVTVEIAGYGDSQATVTGQATTMGIDGGEGSDTIENESTVNVYALSTTDASGITVGLIGYAPASAEISAWAGATGIAGGAGEYDSISNTDTITVLSEAHGTAGGVSVNLAGAAPVSITTTVATDATGIDGQAGSDLILNEGLLTVNAGSDLDVESKTVSIAGASSDDVDTSAEATATGIMGGEGNDAIHNTGVITVGPASDLDDPMANVYAYSSSWTGLGAGSAAATLTADAQSTGMDGGSGDDTVDNQNTLNVRAKSKAESDGSSWVFGGAASTDAVLKSIASAEGITGAGEDDAISNSSLIEVDAIAEAISNATAFSFIGSVSSQALIEAQASAMGIDGGTGANEILNTGEVTVDATSSATATGGASSTFTGADAAAIVSGVSDATGICGGTGDDILINSESASVSVTANAEADADSQAEAGAFFSDSKTRSAVTSASTAYGFDMSEGENTVLNEGSLSVEAGGTATATAVSDSGILSDIFGIDVDAFAVADGTLDYSETIGIMAGDETNQIRSNGVLAVTAAPSIVTHADADASALASGDATADATTTAAGVQAIGIYVGDGDNLIITGESTTVSAEPSVNAYAVTDADGIDAFRQPDSRATATVSADDTLTYGIKAGNGYNEIYNEGAFSVTSAPNADKAEADGTNDFELFGCDGFADTTATADDAQAIGIWSGDGGNLIQNSETGVIVVESTPRAIADSYASGASIGGDAIANATAHADNALAIGIRTGLGNDTIVNDGVLEVTAAPEASATATSAPGPGGSGSTSEVVSTNNAQAIAITSSAGDDTIINRGSIRAWVDADGTSGAGIGITSGSGDDEVVLGEGSSVVGSIDLGNDTDTLAFTGSATVSDSVTGGSGTDTLRFDGAGAIDIDLTSFEAAVKNGAGTFVTQHAPQQMQSLEMNEGTLEINHSYEMADDGIFQAQLFSDGRLGQLRINGTADLDGTLSVIRTPGAFINGTTYDVLEATTLNNWFIDEILPASTPLLSFRVNQLPGTVQVETVAESFTTVAMNPVEMTMARYFDSILPSATGDLPLLLGEFQTLSSSEFGTGFSSLSPTSYDSATQVTLDASQQFTRFLQHRMHRVRSGIASANKAREETSAEPVLLAYNGSLTHFGLLGLGQQNTETPYGIWADVFGQYGDQEGKAGFTGYHYRTGGSAIGMDHAFGDNLIGGLSLECVFTDLDLDGHWGNGDIQNLGGSLYGSWFTEQSYVEGVLSYANQQYDNNRRVLVGGIMQTAKSNHYGNALSASIAGGHDFLLDSWKMGPFGSLQYTYLDEEAFQETGAGSANLRVGRRQTDSLVSELGLHIARPVTTKRWTLIPEVRAGWLYNFDIDDRTISASMADAPGTSFSMRGQDVERHGAVAGAGLTLVRKGGLSIGVRYDAEIREGYQAHSVRGGIRFDF